MSSSFIWEKPDDHSPSMKYPTDQPAGFVEPSSFVSSDRHWQYGSDSKDGVVGSSNGFSDHVAPGLRSVEEEADLEDGQYGELEITIKFTGRAGSSTRSRRLKLMSRSPQNNSGPTVLKSEHPAEESSPPLHRIYSSQDSQRICAFDQETGCACEEFSPSIFRNLVSQALSASGLSIDSSLDHLYSCAVSDLPEDNESRPKPRQASSGKKRLLSNASEENAQSQPNKKNPRLSENIDNQDTNDADDGNERHTCPYFKMYPERHLECGTKDLAQRPKIKSHIIKDHLKKGNIAVPPEIKSQKCEPWDRWCKWIVQDSPKSNRPVPNSTPDFYPILNYIVTAASGIPSDGLTCFSSVMLRLFKSVQTSPNDWVMFITGLEELERSLNATVPTAAPTTNGPSRKNQPQKGDEKPLLLTEDADQEDDPEHQVETVIPASCNDSLAQYPSSETLATTSAYTISQHTPHPPKSYPNIHDPSPTTITEDFAHSHNNLAQDLFPQSNDFEFPNWLNYGMLSADQTMQPEVAPTEPTYYETVPPREQPSPPEPPMESHFSIPPGIGTNPKSLVRAALPPRVRKRKTGTVRSHHVEGAPLNDSAAATQVHTISVLSAGQEQKYEFRGRFSITSFLSFLKREFNFSFDKPEERKIWCVDVREDIQIHAPDGIKAHLKSWSTKGGFTSTPSFRIDPCSDRAFGMEKYAMFTPDFVEELLQNDSMADIDSILSFRPSAHLQYMMR
ncbi:hypothetical protein TWF694_007188 [Orbilia ellipsospora]|uniref:Uncharacterized protein n=1 Tax=Orbilia ellipsospora TaxID=2528407 RepID=A0AAV9XH12_9PEZI